MCVATTVLSEVVVNVVVVGGKVTVLVILVVLVNVLTMTLVWRAVVVMSLKTPIKGVTEAGSKVLIVELPETTNISGTVLDDDVVRVEPGVFDLGSVEAARCPLSEP